MANKTLISTKKAKDTLKYIVKYCDDFGYPPTLREAVIGIGLGSTSTISYRLSVLERLGYIEVTPGVSRGIKVTNEGYRFISPSNYGKAVTTADEQAEVEGKAYFVTGTQAPGGYLAIVSSANFNPAGGAKILYAAWPQELTRCRNG